MDVGGVWNLKFRPRWIEAIQKQAHNAASLIGCLEELQTWKAFVKIALMPS